MHNNSTEELRICGMPQAFSYERALGRLRFFGKGDIDLERTIVYFESYESLSKALSLLASRLIGTPAAALCPCGTPDVLLSALFERGLPYFLLPDSCALTHSLEGRLALLDARSGELIIDPQLETLCRYTLGRESFANGGESIKKGRVCKDIAALSCLEGERVLCDCEDIGGRGELFEETAALVERLYGSPVTIAVKSASAVGEERFCESVEAVLRAAVYGDVSLMLGGALSIRELEGDLSLFCDCFCRLLKEGREFDGYLPRGIFIDSPTLLLEAQSLPRCDFLCFDLGALSERLIDERGKLGEERISKAMLDFWGAWREKNEAVCRSRSIRALCKPSCASGFVWEWCELMGVGEIYIGGI